MKRTVPPRPGCRPSITSGNPKRALSMAMRVLQASATSSPPPRQKPWITATARNLQRVEPVDHGVGPGHHGFDLRADRSRRETALTSAPAMKPDVFAERIDEALAGRSLSSAATIWPSSSITSPDSVLALAPSRSNSSHAMPSLSRVSLKFL